MGTRTKSALKLIRLLNTPVSEKRPNFISSNQARAFIAASFRD